MNRMLATLLVLVFLAPAMAASDRYPFDDDAQRERFRSLLGQLRCVVCQNQNLADSNAALARDMRREVYDLVRGGSSEDEVVDFLVSRYGDFVLYRPPMTSATLALWLGPVLLLGVGAGIALVLVSGSGPRAPGADERRRARAMLGEDE